MDRSNLYMAIDACRALADDLQDPEMAELAELAETLENDDELAEVFGRSQELDRRIGAAMKSGPEPPAGLADRLLEGLEERSGVSHDGVAEADRVSVPRKTDRSEKSGVWRLALGVVAASLLIAGGYAFFHPVDAIAQSAQWMEKLDHNDFTTQAPPVDSHPLSAKVNGVGWYGWQWFDHGAVYWGRGTGNVYLFVLSDERRMRVKATTPGPPTSRGQWSVGAWSSGRQTYVLLVEGGEANYRGVVRPKPTI